MKVTYHIRKVGNKWEWQNAEGETHLTTSRTKALNLIIKKAIGQMTQPGFVVIIEEV